MISLATYWLDPQTGVDRRVTYATDFLPAFSANAGDLVPRVVLLLGDCAHDTGVDVAIFTWRSGWRPPAINAATPNAKKLSRHLTANAGDVAEPASRPLGNWLVTDAGRASLIRRGLYAEHPSATRGATGRFPWVHLQNIAPRSGNRIYYPG